MLDEAVGERRPEPAAVPLVDDGERDLRPVAMIGPGGVAGDADDRVFAIERDEGDVAVVVDLGEEGEVAGG